MLCIKCGRKLEDGQVFCDLCLSDMAEHPVKPGTPVQLPPPQAEIPVKPRKKIPVVFQKPELEINRLRSSVRWLTFILIVLLLAFAFSCVVLIALLKQRLPL